MISPKPSADKLRSEGFIVIPGLLSAVEVDRLRVILNRYFASGKGVVFNLGLAQPNAAAENPDLAELLANPRVKAAYQAVVGDGVVMFTGQADMHAGIISTFHRDTGQDDCYFDEFCFVDECRVYKMGVYLQDHLDGRGLTVHPGSHLETEAPTRPAITIPTRKGDAVLFDVRIVHRGQAPNAFETLLHKLNRGLTRMAHRFFGRPATHGELRFGYSVREAIRRMMRQPPKLSVFFTLGAPDRFTQQFAGNSLKRQFGQYEGGSRTFPPEVVETLQAGGIEIFQPAA
jgi:hypothetical protein